MAKLSRREFGGVLIGGLPLAAAMRSTGLFAAEAPLWVSTSSFRDLPRVEGRDNLDDVIRALKAAGASHLELALANLEPAPPPTAPVMGGSAAYPRRIVLTPEQVAATNVFAREELRAWRLQAHASLFEKARATIASAGLTAHACSVALNDSFSDQEIDATFRQIKALGVKTVSSPLTMAMARRLVPFAERHDLSVAIHNQLDGNPSGAIDTPALKDALSLSRRFSLKLDVGNLTASNCDAVAELRAHASMGSRVSYVLLKDRLRNGGGSQPFGEGDTPIRQVLGLLGTSIPAAIEYDYVGLRSPVEEVKASLAYCRGALAAAASR